MWGSGWVKQEGNMGILKRQITFMIYGLVFWLPVALVIYVGVLLFSNGENVGRMILGVAIPDQYLYTGLGIILCILIIYATGVLLKLTKLGKVFSKIPVIGVFFGQGEIMSVARLMHMQPCLFLYSSTSISYGWIFSQEKVKLSKDNAVFPLINVYFPNVPTLVTGQIFATRKENVMKLANTSSELVNLLLYSFRSPAAIEYIPWEDESVEEFKERAKYFGLK
jgi:uncharacterized membrane protein